MQRLFASLFILLLFSLFCSAHKALHLEQIAPPFWFADMKNPNLQLILHGENFASYQVSVPSKKGVLKEVIRVENDNYLFLNLDLSEVQPGILKIGLTKGRKTKWIDYEIKARTPEHSRAQGLSNDDFIYLIMPDRFANGSPENDIVKTMNETALNRDSMYYRHGGDIQGVTAKLPYLQSLGVTATWLNPIITNDQPKFSYHGYACTDHYEVDPRFGGMEAYLEYSRKSNELGMKVVMDVVHNHTGDRHWLYTDLPMSDFIHQHDSFTRTTYRAPTLLDPYASEADRKLMVEGWFDTHMPDLNQDNALVANYLTQNNIWWVEYGGVDAFRLDTYAYSDPQFLEDWAERMLLEYPTLGIFGETWVHGVPVQAYFHGNSKIEREFNPQLPALTDFQLYYAINDALTNDQGWTSGAAKLYYTLAKDYVYSDVSKNVVFLDNHDLSRFYSVVGEDLAKYKMGIALLMTLRGIPCMYYGTEILMKNFSDPDGKVREDFPGGWQGDAVNKFNAQGRSAEENEAFDFVQKLATYRKRNSFVHSGNMMQFVPQDGLYTFFRYDDHNALMVILNTGSKPVEFNASRFSEMLDIYGFGGTEITNGKSVSLNEIPQIEPSELLLIELKR